MRPRLVAATIAIAAAVMMGIAFYMQYVLGLEPCPLCMTQRICVSLAGAIALLAVLHDRAHRMYAVATGLACVAGGGFATRQLYLQGLPPEEVPACGPDLAYMLEAFPMSDLLQAMLVGTGNCAAVDWSLLGISIAGWVLVGVTGLALLAIWQFASAMRTASRTAAICDFAG